MKGVMRSCLFLALLLALGISGCKEGTVKTGKDFFSYQTNEFNIMARYPVFTSPRVEVDRGCKVVNGWISRLIDSLQNDLKVQLKEYIQKAQEMKEEPMLPFELDIKDSAVSYTHLRAHETA